MCIWQWTDRWLLLFTEVLVRCTFVDDPAFVLSPCSAVEDRKGSCEKKNSRIFRFKCFSLNWKLLEWYLFQRHAQWNGSTCSRHWFGSCVWSQSTRNGGLYEATWEFEKLCIEREVKRSLDTLDCCAMRRCSGVLNRTSISVYDKQYYHLETLQLFQISRYLANPLFAAIVFFWWMGTSVQLWMQWCIIDLFCTSLAYPLVRIYHREKIAGVNGP